MAVNAAKAGSVNTGYYDASSNPNGVIVEGNGGNKYTGNDYLSSHIGEYTDKVVLLKDVSGDAWESDNSVWNFGTSSVFVSLGSGDSYGLGKGLLIDLNSHSVTTIAAGNIPSGQVLVVTDSTGGGKIADSIDDEDNWGHCTGTVVISDITLTGPVFAANHDIILLNGQYSANWIEKEEAHSEEGAKAGSIELRGGYYYYDPEVSTDPSYEKPDLRKFDDIDPKKAVVEKQGERISGTDEWTQTSYGWRVLKVSEPVKDAVVTPEDAYVTAGQQATFTVKATGKGLTYQWYVSRNGGTDWSAVDGATGTSYTTSAAELENDGYVYKCIVTDVNGDSVESNTAVLHVSDRPVPPPTGDSSRPVLWVMTGVLSALAVLMIRKKRTEN